jgi:hypothetical protein
VDPHRRAELRSLAYHRAIAARIVAEPAILERARSRVRAWQQTGGAHPRYCALWKDVLASPLDELKAALVAETEAMTAARQSTPFAGALSARERWSLWRIMEP